MPQDYRQDLLNVFISLSLKSHIKFSLRLGISTGKNSTLLFSLLGGIAKHISLKSLITFFFVNYMFMSVEVLIFFLLTCRKTLCIKNIICCSFSHKYFS